MGRYKISDFEIGDTVFHLSNYRLKMVIIAIHKELNEVECRWLDNNGHIQSLNFMSEELDKPATWGASIIASSNDDDFI